MPVEPPCAQWATIEDVMAWDCGDCKEIDAYQLAMALEDASFALNAWSAFAYNGICESTVRPTPSYGPSHGYVEWVPPVGAYSWGMWPFGYSGGAFWGGPFGYAGFGMCGGGCSSVPLAREGCHGGPSQIALGAYPVRSITEVVIDGAVVPPAEYRVDDERWLVRVPAAGEAFAHWPVCNDLAQPADVGDTDHHTMQVSFTWGYPPPDTGVRAAIDLACMIAAQRCAGESCAVPQNATQIAREGVTVMLVRPSEEVLDNFPLSVRSFLNAVNPNSLRTRPRVYSPDLPRTVVQTTWP